ncbi:hypothetical protein Tsubulata_009701 [Turnera subulata]|uniref:Uncharacterized protein n=1 Tax=Turnera subulata TaxID=218843 RepID=A0A9Q0FTT7_9ROSI|nr:hypothetical protein Tsubulata_009701 [Turnera subulata]
MEKIHLKIFATIVLFQGILLFGISRANVTSSINEIHGCDSTCPPYCVCRSGKCFCGTSLVNPQVTKCPYCPCRNCPPKCLCVLGTGRCVCPLSLCPDCPPHCFCLKGGQCFCGSSTNSQD